MTSSHPFQRGFAAVTAVFLLVVLAGLGAFMLTFSNTQQVTSAQDVVGSRAYWAARAGLEWGIASTVAACPTSPKTLTGVNSFTVVITCSSQAYSEADRTVTIFRFTSVASSAGTVGGVGYIERSVSASMER